MKVLLVSMVVFTIFIVSNCSKSPTKSETPIAPIKPAPKDTMSLIDNAVFQMGGNGSTDESPSRLVSLSSYYIDTTEVTQAEYLNVTGKNPSTYRNDSLKPVEQVTWFDAVLFCNARSKRDHFDTIYTYDSIIGTPYLGCSTLVNININYNKNGYRLPTEAEWENACRSQTISIYYWGNGTGGYRSDTLAADSNAVWRNNSSNLGSHRVASLKPNQSGLYDMSGNVMEWCNDYYSSSYNSGNLIDPTGPTSGNERVMRGGSWSSQLTSIRSAIRFKMEPMKTSSFTGFRCVRTKLN